MGRTRRRDGARMATIYRRGKTWWGRFQYHGNEFRKSLETTARSVAQKRLTKWENATKAAGWGEGAGKTYDDAMVSFLDNHCPTLRPKSVKRYEVSAKQLTAFFSGLPLSQITSSKLADYEATRRRDEVSAPTIRRDLACLSSMFTHAIVDREWVETNPVLAFLKRQKRRGRLKESPPKTRYLSVDEERKMLAACFVDINGKPLPKGSLERAQAQADAIAFAIDTGLRREEQWSLPWSQVVLTYKDKKPTGGEILITKEIAKGKRERRIPLFQRSAQILARLPRRDSEGNDYPAVFVNPEGKRFAGRNKGLREAAKRAGIPAVTWHDLRRTCGCRLLQEHEFSLEQVREWLGHESVQQTERAYAFLGADALQAAVHKSAQRRALLTRRERKKP